MCTKVSLELLGPVEAIVKISTLDVAWMIVVCTRWLDCCEHVLWSCQIWMRYGISGRWSLWWSN